MASRLREVATRSERESSLAVLSAAGDLVASTSVLYADLDSALPDFATALDTSLRVLGQSIENGRKKVNGGQALSQESRQLLGQLATALSDVSRHTFTMATSDASLESFLLPDNLMSIRVKMRLEELDQLIKGFHEEFSSKDERRSSTSQLQTDDAKNFWDLLFGGREEVELGEFYETITAVLGREPRCPPEKLSAFFGCDLIDPLNFDRFSSLLNTNRVQAADENFLKGIAASVSQYLKSQIRIGHLRDAIPQGDSNEPIRPLDSRTRSVSIEMQLGSPFSPRGDGSDESKTSRSGDQSGTLWLKKKMDTWFREVDRIYRFFHGDISRDDAESLLRGRPSGTFLLRYSSVNPSRYCISFVHAIPVRDHDSCFWKENIRRRDVIIHHELLCTNVKEATSPRQSADDITRSFTLADVSPRRLRKGAVNGKKAFSSLHQVIKSGALLEETLRPPSGQRLPEITR
ncbi:uncharacterized protein [Diadema antillarum]|uniref:uncharacterized protein n=1 Tax=Diadema antillarum TaxID=105358 RepID=UPI003A8556F4